MPIAAAVVVVHGDPRMDSTDGVNLAEQFERLKVAPTNPVGPTSDIQNVPVTSPQYSEYFTQDEDGDT